jgi:type IV pilus assembly protein PilB
MKRIGEMLVESGVLEKQNLNKALDIQKNLKKHKQIGEILVEMEYITIDTLIKYLTVQLEKRINKP